MLLAVTPLRTALGSARRKRTSFVIVACPALMRDMAFAPTLASMMRSNSVMPLSGAKPGSWSMPR